MFNTISGLGAAAPDDFCGADASLVYSVAAHPGTWFLPQVVNSRCVVGSCREVESAPDAQTPGGPLSTQTLQPEEEGQWMCRL